MAVTFIKKRDDRRVPFDCTKIAAAIHKSFLGSGLERMEVQSRRRVRNSPFLMGQGVWLDSETLGPDDEIREVIKHGTLSIGFIGLAECLTALIGEHHGQSERAQALGLEIIGRIRARADRESEARRRGLSVWVYTGYRLETLCECGDSAQLALLDNADVLVDGSFVLAERSPEPRWRGSRNQRLIDLNATRANHGIIVLLN